MNSQQLRWFLTVCDSTTLTGAAARCGTSQPVLNRSILALEKEFGGALLQRRSRFIFATELGEAVRPYLEDMACAIEDATDVAKRYLTQVQAVMAQDDMALPRNMGRLRLAGQQIGK